MRRELSRVTSRPTAAADTTRPAGSSGGFWALLLLLGAGVWFFQAQGGIPPSVGDLARRALPAILIAFGLMLFIARRVRFGNFIAVILTAIVVFGVATAAYSRQAAVVRTDYAAPILLQVPNTVNTLSVDIGMGLTAISIKSAALGDRAIRGEYIGTLESEVSTDFQVNGSAATLTINERARNNLPSLELIGRGVLNLTLPAGLPITQFNLITREGAVTVDATTLALRGVKIETGTGDLTVTLGTESGLIGDLKANGGNLTLGVPAALSAQIALRGTGASGAQFNASLYTLSIERVLVPKTNAPNAQLTVEGSGQIVISGG